jgi:hypothetical protein
VGVIFGPIGGVLLWASSQVQEISIDYSACSQLAPECENASGAPPTDNQASYIPSGKVSSHFKNSTSDGLRPQWCYTNTSEVQTYGGQRTIPGSTICHVQFELPDTLDAPVLLYYQLTNFYQNHRRYVKSFDQDQLAGHARTAKDIQSSDCSPLEGEVWTDGTWKPYYPCGLIANSRFNDSIQNPVLLNTDNNAMNQTYNMTTNNTAWSSDATLYKPTQYKYGEAIPPPNWRQVYPEYNETAAFNYPPIHTDDSFAVWMRTAGLPTFSKLARRNDHEKMVAGRYQIDIYDCTSHAWQRTQRPGCTNATMS